MFPAHLRLLKQLWLKRSASGRRGKHQRGRAQRLRPHVELLEIRLAPAVDHWTGLGGNTNFSTPGNWDTNAVPAVADTIVFDGTATNSMATVDASFTHGVAAMTVAASWTGTITIASPLTVAGAASFANGTLTGPSSLTVGGLLTWTNGTMSGTGTTTAAGGLQLGAAGDAVDIETLDARTLNNAGAGVWIGDGYYDFYGAHEHYFNQLNGSVFNNEVGASLNIQNDARWYSNVSFQFGYLDRPYSQADASKFINAGSLIKSAGAGTTEIDVPITDSGSVAVQQSTLSLAGGGTASGSFNVAAGATLGLDSFFDIGSGDPNHTMYLTSSSSASGAGIVEIGDYAQVSFAGAYNVSGAMQVGILATLNFTAGASVQPIGAVLISGGTVNFSSGANVAIQGLTMVMIPYTVNNSPTLTGSDSISVSGPANWTTGTISGSGTLTTHGGLTIDLGLLSLDGRTLNLASNTTVAGNNGGAEGLLLTHGATINNQAGQTFDIQVDYPNAIDTGAIFNNAGILQKSSGTGFFGINGVFNNSGMVLAKSGRLYAGDSGTDSGSYTASAEATLQLTGANLTAASSIAGDGTIQFVGNDPSNVGGAYDCTGATIIDGQTVNFTGTIVSLVGGFNSLDVDIGTVHFKTAVPGLGDNPVIKGTADFSTGQSFTGKQLDMEGGYLTGSDNLTFTGLITCNGGHFQGTGQLNADGGLIMKSADLDGRTLNIRDGADLSAGIEVYNGGMIHNCAGSTVHVHDGEIGGYTNSPFNNDGTIIKSIGTDIFYLQIPVNGAGTIEVDLGTLGMNGGEFDGTVVVQTGATLAVPNGGEWELGANSSVIGGGAVTFSNLTIDGGYNLTGPTSSDTSSYSYASNLTINSNITMPGSLNIKGDLTVNGNAVVTGALTLISSILLGTGELTAQGGLTIQGNCYLAGASLKNAGACLWDGQGILEIYRDSTFTNETGATLTVQGGRAAQYIYGGETGTFANAGTLVVNAGSLIAIIEATVVNTGTLAIQSGTLNIPGIETNGSGFISGSASSTLLVSGRWGDSVGNITGATTNAARFAPLEKVEIDPPVDVTSPVPLEVMSADLGATAAGFAHNFAYNQLTIKVTGQANSLPPIFETIQLVNKAKNSSSAGAEALYVNTLIIAPEFPNDPSSTGGTFDLNGLHVYARLTQIDPTVKIINGTITMVPDGGPLPLGWPALGTISAAGAKDDWTFFGNSGQLFAATLNTGSGAAAPPLAPTLDNAQIKLIDPSGNVVASTATTAPGADAALSGIHLPVDGTYHVVVQASAGQPTSTGNYILTVQDTTPHTGALNLGQNASGVLTTSFSIDTWTFAAVAGTQVQFHLLNAANNGIQFDLSGPAGYSGFTNQISDSGILTLPANGAYTVSVHGSQGQSGAYSFRVDEPNPAVLTLGTPYGGALVASGQEQLFRLTLIQSSPLLVSLKDAATADHNELYLTFGVPPTRERYQYAAPKLGLAGQQILVPSAAPGDYYVLVYCESAPKPSTFTLVATATNEVITAIAPTEIGNGQDMTLSVTGAGFDAAAAVSLVSADGANSFPAASVQVDGSGQLTAVFSAGAVPPGSYGIQVTRGDGASALLPTCLTVFAGGTGVLETKLSVPFPIGYHLQSTFYVEYRNSGTGAMRAPLLKLTGIMNGVAGAQLSLDPTNANVAYGTDFNPPGFSQSVQILASGATPGWLQPGEDIVVPVYYAGWLHSQWDLTRPPINFNLTATQADDLTPIDWSSSKDSLRPPSVSATVWNAIFPNLISQLGSTWGSLITRFDNIASYLGHLGETVTDVGRLWTFSLTSAIGFSPLGALAGDTDASVDAPGLSLSFARSFGPSILDRNRLGRLGYGWSDNWDVSLQVDAAGDVVVNGPGSAQRTFIKNASYFIPQPGDHGNLTVLPDGTYTLLEKNGDLTAFNADGTLDYYEDVNGNKITAGYTGGRLISLTHSSGQSLQLHYNPAGLIDTVTDSAGRKTTYMYDGLNQLSAVTGFDGLTTKYAYKFTGFTSATDHALISITAPDGSMRQFSYDALGRLTDTSLNDNAEDLAVTYDSFGTVTIKDAVQQQDPTSTGTRMFFDDRSLPVRVENQFHSTVVMTYDNNLNITGVTNGAGQSYQFAYDPDGNLIRSTDPLNGTQHYVYTSLASVGGVSSTGNFDRLASATDANGNSTQYQSDANGNLRSITYADGTQEGFTYDPLGNPLSFTNRRGNVIKETTDDSGRVKSLTFADGAKLEFTYDSHGNLKTAQDASGAITLTYDAGDRLTGVSYPGGRSLTFIYDPFGRRSQMIDQDQFTVKYSYDPAGRLAGLTDGQNNLIVSYTYDAAGRITRKDLGNGTYTTYLYDESGQLLDLINHAPDGTVNSRSDYSYDEFGRTISMTTTEGTWHYSYDAAGRLTSVAYPGGQLQYTYDAAGNRTAVTDNNGTTTYTVNSLNETTSIGNSTLTYDLDGNLISQSDGASTNTYQYDELNRLIGAATPSGAWSYQYDAFGNLSSSVDNLDLQTSYLVDPTGLGDVVGLYQGTQSTHYTYGLGLVSQVSGAGANYYDFDAIGSTVGLSGPAGSYLNTYTYQPFGELRSSTGQTPNPFTYVGAFGVMSQTNGLSLMRARFYAPGQGRFLSVDPLKLPAASAYVYAANNPISLIDPKGTDPIRDQLLTNLRLASEAYSAEFYCPNGGDSPDLPQLQQAVDIARQKLNDYDANTRANTQPAAPLIPIGVAEGLGAAGRAVFRAGVILTITVGGGFALGAAATILLPATLAASLGGSLVALGVSLGFAAAGVLIPPHGSGSSTSHTKSGGSKDPNDKIGPAAFGADGFITPDQVFPYRIDFENDPTATAPAQVVTVTDQLDQHLDWNTFQLSDVGFGSTELLIPAGSRHYQTTVSMTYNNQTFEVDIELGIHSDTGEVYATFQSVNPQTELPPDILTGFLPPEDGAGIGMGHFSYLIYPKASLPTGTQIRNVAVIVFDDNPPLATDLVDDHDPSKGIDPTKQVLRTIDVGAPTSTVTALPANSPNGFTLSWSGSDDTGGSGIGAYDIYVSDNGGPFTAFQTATAATSAPFTGTPGDIYSFYSVATDNVGHRQPTPAAQASTTIIPDSAPPSSTVAALPAFSRLTFTVTWSGSDNAGGSGLAGYDIFVSDNGGPVTAFQTATTQTSASFTGVVGHTYAFYSVATDNAGNRETAPGTPQATTMAELDTPNKQYVAAVYVTLLQRSVDLEGLNYWSGVLDSGSQRGVTAASLTHSAEYYQTNVIKPAYQKFLNRNADPGGLAYWTTQLQGGLTDEQMQAGYIASPEFYANANHSSSPVPRSPAADRKWVDALYESLLGRGPDQTGEDYWTGQLQGPETLIEVANDFTGSTEGLSVRIQQTYERYLGRGADAGGLAFWLNQYHQGAVNEDIVTGFISSDEFFKQATS